MIKGIDFLVSILLISLIFVLMSIIFKDLAYSQDKRIRVAIIDTGLALDDRFSGVVCDEKSIVNLEDPKLFPEDRMGHGTHIAGIIRALAPSSKACLMIYRALGFGNNKEGLKNVSRALNMAIDDGANYINMSYGGPTFDETEYLALKRATDKGIILIAAAGNDNKNIDLSNNFYYPASYHLPREIVVGSLGLDLKPASSSNYGSSIVTWQPGKDIMSTWLRNESTHLSGTSQATAVETGLLVRKALGLPDIEQSKIWDYLETYWTMH